MTNRCYIHFDKSIFTSCGHYLHRLKFQPIPSADDSVSYLCQNLECRVCPTTSRFSEMRNWSISGIFFINIERSLRFEGYISLEEILVLFIAINTPVICKNPFKAVKMARVRDFVSALIL